MAETYGGEVQMPQLIAPHHSSITLQSVMGVQKQQAVHSVSSIHGVFVCVQGARTVSARHWHRSVSG